MSFSEVTHPMLTENVLNTFAVRLYTAALVNEYVKSKFNERLTQYTVDKPNSQFSSFC